MSETYRKRSLFPKTLGQCIDPLVKPVFREFGLAGTRIIQEWAFIVGDRMAERSIPSKLAFPKGKTTDGTLTIAVEGGFALEIQHSQHLILERLAVFFGYRAVSKLQFSQTLSPKTASALVKPASRSSKPLAPVLDIEDEELKNALFALSEALTD